MCRKVTKQTLNKQNKPIRNQFLPHIETIDMNYSHLLC